MSEYKILNSINSSDDIKSLSYDDIELLCSEIRDFLICNVEKTGGHLASNLGVVELSIAMHKVFDSPIDHIIFDVGHQAYVHKIITGRKERFDTLRKTGGLSGFTSMKESAHDAFGAGHSSTSISAGLGYAESDKIDCNEKYTVCVVGDGAMTGGMIHEAINNCDKDLRFIIVLNENGMSISSNKGAFASYLSRFRSSPGYNDAKAKTTNVLKHTPLFGNLLLKFISFAKKVVKRLLFVPNYFEELGFYYIGPVDGNDYKKVEKALSEAKKLNKCVFVHLKTKKGKGLNKAEMLPEKYHSISCGTGSTTYHDTFGEVLSKIAQGDEKIVGVTAAMGIGTGLEKFGEQYPSRYFDVGIAEEHALTFAAGLAANGFKPYVAIYSTFLQRGYDNIIHDIALQELPVRIVIDRAGIAVSDGATHHGIFDVSFLSHTPNVKIYAPISHRSLTNLLNDTVVEKSPIAIRYSNSDEPREVVEHFGADNGNSFEKIRFDFDLNDIPKKIYVSYGRISQNVLEAKKQLKNKGIDVGFVLVEQIKPYIDAVDFLQGCISEGTHLVYVEEGIKNGGAAMITANMLRERGINCKFDIVAIDDNFACPDSLCDIYDHIQMSPSLLVEKFLD